MAATVKVKAALAREALGKAVTEKAKADSARVQASANTDPKTTTTPVGATARCRRMTMTSKPSMKNARRSSTLSSKSGGRSAPKVWAKVERAKVVRAKVVRAIPRLKPEAGPPPVLAQVAGRANPGPTPKVRLQRKADKQFAAPAGPFLAGAPILSTDPFGKPGAPPLPRELMDRERSARRTISNGERR
jgi:hypothetical protein